MVFLIINVSNALCILMFRIFIHSFVYYVKVFVENFQFIILIFNYTIFRFTKEMKIQEQIMPFKEIQIHIRWRD